MRLRVRARARTPIPAGSCAAKPVSCAARPATPGIRLAHQPPGCRARLKFRMKGRGMVKSGSTHTSTLTSETSTLVLVLRSNNFARRLARVSSGR